MEEVKVGKKRWAALALAAALAASMCAPAAAFADNGLQDGTQTYSKPTGESATYAWDPATNTGEAGGGGQVQIVYSTEGGTWDAPGASTTETTDNVKHPNGTYLVTIPKKIQYEKMSIGTVNTSDEYDVTVAGALDSGDKVTLTATGVGTPVTLTNSSAAAGDTSEVKATTTLTKSEWSADDAFGSELNTDGSLKGTTGKNTIALSGTAKTSGTWKGVVTYTASMVSAS